MNRITAPQGCGADPHRGRRPPSVKVRKWQPGDSFAQLLAIATMEPDEKDKEENTQHDTQHDTQHNTQRR